MWVLSFLLLALPLCKAAALGEALESYNQKNDIGYVHNGADVQDISSEMEKITSEFLQDLIDARSSPGKRQKREMSYMKTSSLADKQGIFRLRRIKPFLSVCSRPTNIIFLDVQNSTYAVCLSTYADESPTTANIAQITTKGIIPLDSWYTNNPSKAVAFHDTQQLYILVADSGRGDGTDLIKFNYDSQKSSVDHTVHSKHATAIALWKMKMDGSYHLAIANSDGNRDASDLTTEIFTYNWMGTYFDRYSSITAYDVKDIEPFHIHNMAYLAVANHRRGKANYHVDSEIFKYNVYQNKWLSLQKIRTYGAMDWEFFTFGKSTGKEFFLAVANYVEQGNHDINSVIYKFVKDKFVPFQCLLTSGATSIATFSDGSKFLLAIGNEFEAVHLYQYDGWRFMPSSVQFTQSTMSSGVTSVSFHTILDYEESKLVIAVSNPKMDGPSLYEVEFVHENALGKWHNDSTEWCLNFLDYIAKSDSEETIIDMKNVIYTDQQQPIIIDGNLHFQNGFRTSVLLAPKVIDIKSEKIYDDSVLLKLKELKRRLNTLELRLQKTEEILTKAVNINGNETLIGNYKFEDVTFNCADEKCHFDRIDTTFLNGEDLSDLEQKVFFLDEDTFIDEPLSIEKVKVKDLDVLGLIDGVSVSTIVTKSGSHHITGTKTFINPIKSAVIDVSGFVDGVQISPQTALLNGGFQNVTGKLSFEDIETNSLEVTGLANGVDLNEFYRNMVLADKSYVIRGSKKFSKITGKDLYVKSINGVELTELWNNVMWTDKRQEVTASMNFLTISVVNDLVLDGKVNGLKIPGQVVLINSSAVISAPKLFKEDTKTSRLDVTGSINGIGVLNVSGKPQLDILMKNGDEVVTGQKTFREIFLDDDSYVYGTVNGVDLSEFQRTALRNTGSPVSEDTWVFQNLEVKGPLTVHGHISGYDLEDIYNRALKLNDTVMPNFESLSFEGGLYINNLHSDDVNGLELVKDLVFTKEPQEIKGIKTFEDARLEADSEVFGLVNNINIGSFKDTILKVGNQKITIPITLERNIRVEHLTIKSLINSIGIGDLVTLNGDETIAGPKTFMNVKVDGNLYVKNLEVSGLVNEIDINEMLQSTMTYDGEQMVSGIKSVTGRITLSKDSNLNTDSLNEIDISSIWEDAVLVDVPQTVTGSKVFSGPVSFEKFWFHKSLDGTTEWDLKHNWMFQDLDQEISGDVILANDVIVSDITIVGYFNNANITELNRTIVKKNEPTVITGTVIFEDNVISYGNVSLAGRIQNIDLSEEAVLKSGHNVITGEKKFHGDLTVTNLIVAGKINGVLIEDFCDSVFLKEKNLLGEVTVKGNVIFEDSVQVDGLFAGVDIDAIYGIAAQGDEETFIDGLKTFESLTIEGPVTLFGKVGGVDLKLLNDTYMSLSLDQEVATSLSFDNIAVQGTVSASNFYTHDNEINGINIVQLEKRLLRTYGTQSINVTYRFDKVTFSDDVIVVGRVNAIEIPKGLMRQHRANYIYNSKIFKQNVTVLGDLAIEDGKNTQDVDVSEWKRKAVLKDGRFVIDGVKTFNDVTMNDVWVYGTINGVKISEDNLLMTYGDQHLNGQKKIVGSITLLRNLTVDGLINGVDLDDVAKRAARRGHSNTFTGAKYFTQLVTIGALETGFIDRVDILELNRMLEAELNFTLLLNRAAELKETLSQTQEIFDTQAVLFQYYEYFQGFSIPGSYTWHYVASPDTKELLLLSDTSPLQNGCTSIKTFLFDIETQRFELKKQSLFASYAVAMKSIFIWDVTYLFVANRIPRTCSSATAKYEKFTSGNETAPGHIFVWDDENDLFTPYQILKMEPAADVAVFSDHDTVCAVYAEMRDTKVYCANETQKEFLWRETLETRFGRKISLIEDESDWPIIRIAIAGVDGSRDYVNYVDIYVWKGDAFKQPIQRIKVSNPQSVMFMLYPDAYSSSLFLVISDETVASIRNDPRLLIYRLDEEGKKFLKYQEIKDAGHLEWMTLPNGDLIFYVLNRIGNINIYRYTRATSFVKEDTLYATGAQTLHAFSRMDPEDSNHYLALAGSQSILPEEPQATDFAKLLKSNIKGKRLLY